MNLLVCAEIKCRAAQKNVSAVEVRGDKLIIIRRGKGMQLDGRYPRLEEAEAGERLLEVREWIKKL